MGYAEPDSALELFTASGADSAFVAAGPSAESPRLLHANFAAANCASLPPDPVLGPPAAEAQAQAFSPGAAPDTPPAAAIPQGAYSPGWTV